MPVPLALGSSSLCCRDPCSWPLPSFDPTAANTECKPSSPSLRAHSSYRDIQNAAQRLMQPNPHYADAVDARQVTSPPLVYPQVACGSACGCTLRAPTGWAGSRRIANALAGTVTKGAGWCLWVNPACTLRIGRVQMNVNSFSGTVTARTA